MQAFPWHIDERRRHSVVSHEQRHVGEQVDRAKTPLHRILESLVFPIWSRVEVSDLLACIFFVTTLANCECPLGMQLD